MVPQYLFCPWTCYNIRERKHCENDTDTFVYRQGQKQEHQFNHLNSPNMIPTMYHDSYDDDPTNSL